ncbi:unnamed protein product [Diatraea saccharalis]|uniref:Eukaryotic translation initiation factor 4E n=1 Tax=Diatraea saccharalis TaxID=40085 RepID=A0A9N9QWU5_9NEOP|nr:unnamed protein product [Diatraea saccharalis]
MKLPSELMNGQDYSVFKKGIRPMWEDQANKRGARLLITLDKKNHQEMDSIWLDTVLMMIGENFDDLNHKIRGAVVNVRPKGNKIGIWLANKNDEADNIRLIKKLKQVLGISKRLTFYGHNSNMALYNA